LASRVFYHAAVYVPGGFTFQPSLAILERAGLRGDMQMNKLQHKLGDPRGKYDEGPQDQGTTPITHLGPRLNLPGAHSNGKKDIDPLIPESLQKLIKKASR
jgi:hypothetical protein